MKFKELPVYLKILFPILLIPIIFLVLWLWLIFRYYKILKNGLQSKNWATIEGTVHTSWIRGMYSEYSSNFEIDYSYVVGGVEYKSEKVDERFSEIGEREGKQLVARFPVGKPVTIYYHPQHPQQAVLIPGLHFSLSYSFLLVFLSLLAFTLQMFLWAGLFLGGDLTLFRQLFSSIW